MYTQKIAERQSPIACCPCDSTCSTRVWHGLQTVTNWREWDDTWLVRLAQIHINRCKMFGIMRLRIVFNIYTNINIHKRIGLLLICLLLWNSYPTVSWTGVKIIESQSSHVQNCLSPIPVANYGSRDQFAFLFNSPN